MKTIEQKAEYYYKNLTRPLPNSKALVVTAYCIAYEQALRDLKLKEENYENLQHHRRHS